MSTGQAANRRPQQVEGRSVQCGPARTGQRGLGMNLSEYSSGWAPSVPQEDSFVLGEGLYGHCQVADTAATAALVAGGAAVKWQSCHQSVMIYKYLMEKNGRDGRARSRAWGAA